MNIAILASGGDGSGMKLFLYHVVKKLKNHNITLFKSGFCGLCDDITCDFDLSYIKEHRNDGGIMIKTSRCEQFMTKQGQDKAINTLKRHKIDVVIVMGGNGTLKGAEILHQNGVKVVFVPCSIDNDVSPSEYSIGFDTACQTCVEYIQKVNDTMLSFDRGCVYEVMGRHCDAIAKKVGQLVDADYVYKNTSTLKQCVQALKKSKKSAPIVVLQENVTDVSQLSKNLESEISKEVKFCVVGYIQRGGKPSKKEKAFARLFATCSADAVNNDSSFSMCAVKNNNVTCLNLS